MNEEKPLPRDFWEVMEFLRANQNEREMLLALRNRAMYEMFKSGTYTRRAIAEESSLSYRQVQQILVNQKEIESYLAEREVNLGPRPGPPLTEAQISDKSYQDWKAEEERELVRQLREYRAKYEAELAAKSKEDPVEAIFNLSPQLQAAVIALHERQQAAEQAEQTTEPESA